MLVFKEFENNEFSILDTEDNVIESISGDELLNILCTTDLEIQGLSLNSKGFVVDDTKTVLYKPVKVKNSNLTKAKKAKNDEFYTQLSDIEKELSHYPIETFKDKVIYCPCDSVDMSNGYISNFAVYFCNNFKVLGIKKLICTCYSDGINYFEYDGKTELKESRGSGDFRSEYCTKLLQEADIVVTNPPFSLFRAFYKWIQDANKKFIILGDKNSINYLCPDIMSNKLWVGVSIHSGERYFNQPDGTLSKGIGVRWFTNVDINIRHESLIGLSMQDNINKGVKYIKYDNFNAIEVSKTKDIPMDYEGIMGVPITYIDKHCPDQFDIVGSAIAGYSYCTIDNVMHNLDKKEAAYLNGKKLYARILIRHRKDENGKLI